MNKFLYLLAIVIAISTTTNQALAQQQAPPPLEKPATGETTTAPTSLGKVTIQISQTEQIVIDLPLKTDNKYQIVPIK
ncbi:MAG: hypothetical protein K0S93_180 [Nitrososphaeraceae archaeon]|jgi:hypothetical protein|nr:hypothetical protein [Nitrososphaeraceae archaeon]